MLLDSLDLMTQTLAPRLFGLLDTPLSWTMTKNGDLSVTLRSARRANKNSEEAVDC